MRNKQMMQNTWILVLVVAVGLFAFVEYGATEPTIKRGSIQCSYSVPLEGDKYIVDLSLRDGFSSFEAEMELKFLPKARKYYHGDDGCERTILLYMDGKINVRDVAPLELICWNWATRKAETKLIEPEEVLIDEDEKMLAIRFEQEPTGYVRGKLSINYEGSSTAFSSEASAAVEANVDPLELGSPATQMRLRWGEAVLLFPRFDKNDLYPGTDLELNIKQQGYKRILVSNVPTDGGSIVIKNWYNLGTNYKRVTSNLANRLALALVPRFEPKKPERHSSPPRPRISQASVLDNQRTEEFLRDVDNWMTVNFPIKAFQMRKEQPYHKRITIISPKNLNLISHLNKRLNLNLDLDLDLEFDELNIEKALSLAMIEAFKLFELLQVRHDKDSWQIDGLATHYAIRMVRELRPELRVDEYVRETLLPWALEQETSGHHSELKPAYELANERELPMDKREPEIVLLWRIKCAAIVDMLARNFIPDRETFHGLVLARMRDHRADYFSLPYLIHTLRSDQVSYDEIEDFINRWAESPESYPYIGLALDKRNKSIRLDQVPISWFNDRDTRQVKGDDVWPMSIKLKFTDGTRVEYRQVRSKDGFDGKRTVIWVKLPDWFNHSEPISRHKFELDLLDQQELPYYRTSYLAAS